MLEALLQANQFHAPSYGTDAWSERAEIEFQKHFGEKAKVFFVFNGTAANALALRALVKPYQATLCSDLSHLNVDECGAPEFFSGSKLISLKSKDGKLSLADLRNALVRRGDQHSSQIKALSLTQPTELGTCYTLEEMKAIADWAHSEKIWLHVDGSRLSNAALHLNCTFQQLITETGVDVVSFGGTKNGFLFGEALVFLNPKLSEDFKYIRKQSAQLPSKTRFLAAQFEAYLQNDTWKKMASHSCQMAQMLYEKLLNFPQLKITVPRQSNAVFVQIPKAWVQTLRKEYFFYVWDEKTFECRLMTSWDTTESDIQGFTRLIEAQSEIQTQI